MTLQITVKKNTKIPSLYCEEGLTIFRELDDKIGLVQGLNILGNIHRNQEDFERSYEVYQQCLELCYETGEQRRIVMALGNLSKVSLGLGNVDEAKKLAYDTIQMSRDIHFDYMTVLQLGTVPPGTLVKLGKIEQAATILGASAALREKVNIHHQPNNLDMAKQIRAEVSQKLGDGHFRNYMPLDIRCPLTEAVAFALNELED